MTIEETQLNELVSSVKNTLQADGTLNKIKAQLRASVIKVLEPAKTKQQETRTDLEIQALQVIQECLQALNANATLDVLLVETNFMNLPKQEFKSDPKNPLLYKLLDAYNSQKLDRRKETLEFESKIKQVPDKPVSVKAKEIEGLSSLKDLPSLNPKKEVSDFPRLHGQSETTHDQYDEDIIETFDVISDDSDENAKEKSDTEEHLDKLLSQDFGISDKVSKAKEVVVQSKDDKSLNEPETIKSKPLEDNNSLKKTLELGSLKGLPPLKLSPLKRDLPSIDSLAKSNLNQLNKDILENQLDKDPELQETFDRLQKMDTVAVEPLDLTEDISIEEETNLTEDISEIHTTDRSVSPRFISSTSGHDYVEECRPKEN